MKKRLVARPPNKVAFWLIQYIELPDLFARKYLILSGIWAYVLPGLKSPNPNIKVEPHQLNPPVDTVTNAISRRHGRTTCALEGGNFSLGAYLG